MVHMIVAVRFERGLLRMTSCSTRACGDVDAASLCRCDYCQYKHVLLQRYFIETKQHIDFVQKYHSCAQARNMNIRDVD